ncbi:MAG: iron-containing alcohol dehydrogenase [Muribaculaceae bacterium]|nr:iron-containing alcohol dehydrogenase [Muribaculaceae bacterium]
MLGNFIYYNPTKLYFGTEVDKNLKDALENYGKKVLLVYGGGSIKSNGIYDTVIKALKETGKEVVELSGVMPNPTLEKLNEGILLARNEDVDLILAVGGGSTIDYSKGVAAGAFFDGDAWTNFWLQQKEPAPDQKIIPVGSVLTLAGTGSEMNGGSVITDEKNKLKVGKVFGERLIPKFSVLNPEYTFSLPQNQMVAGIYDIMSHIMEQYFSGDDDSTSDYISEGLMRSLIASSRVAVKDPKNYEARSNIMWIATWALNTLIGKGKKQDWMVHMIAHTIGAFTHATHGMALSAISAAYYRFILKYGEHRFARFARVVWEIPSEGKTDSQLASEGIDALENWIKEIGAASDIEVLGVTDNMLEEIAATTFLGGGYKEITKEDIVAILKDSLKRNKNNL